MNLEELNKKYFSSGSRGFKIISSFYNKYADLFKKTIFQDFKDFSNQIFLGISRIDFSKDIRNEEAYIIGAVKIQCRVLLDKAIKSKIIIPESRLNELNYEEPDESLITNAAAKGKVQQIEKLEAEDLFNYINIFKMQLNENEIRLLNCLIDEKSRYEIAGEININLNTLDTHIRRLRIKFSRYLSRLGYSDKSLKKYN